MSDLQTPYYHSSVDWKQFVRDYPPPSVYFETMYRWPRPRVEAMQLERAQAAVKRAWRVPFYRKRWDAAGFHPDALRTLRDLEKIPPYTVHDLRGSLEAKPPFGEHQWAEGEPPFGRMPLKVQTSGGTTGKPRPTLYGPVEWEIQGLQMARAFWAQGARPGDRIQIPATLSMANLGWASYKAVHDWLGALPITTGAGTVTPTEQQVEMIHEWSVTMLVGFPEYLLRLAEAARAMNLSTDNFRVKSIHTYLGPDVDNQLRAKLEQAWNADVYDNYGAHEFGLTSFECAAKGGMHTFEDTVVYEILDVDSDRPLGPGANGNLCVTSLHKTIFPVIRFNTLDYTRLTYDACTVCGSPSVRLAKHLGRSDDMVKLRGQNVWPMACVNAVAADSRSTGEFFCVVDRVNDRDDMTVMVEYVNDAVDRAAMARDLEVALHRDLGIRVTVQPVPPDSLIERTGVKINIKPRRLLDKRFSKGG